MSVTEEVVSATRQRVIAAAVRCLAAQGLRRTTVDDIATEAGVSRATLYRSFPGGRDTVIAAMVDAERTRFIEAVGAEMGRAGDLRDALGAGVVAAARFLTTHEALERVMFDDPAVVLTHLEFAQMDRTLAATSEVVAPLFGRFLEEGAAVRAAEWAARVVLSYLLLPADELDLTIPADAQALVDRHVLPGVLAIAADGAP